MCHIIVLTNNSIGVGNKMCVVKTVYLQFLCCSWHSSDLKKIWYAFLLLCVCERERILSILAQKLYISNSRGLQHSLVKWDFFRGLFLWLSLLFGTNFLSTDFNIFKRTNYRIDKVKLQCSGHLVPIPKVYCFCIIVQFCGS